jgi:hypothetical protein
MECIFDIPFLEKIIFSITFDEKRVRILKIHSMIHQNAFEVQCIMAGLIMSCTNT